MSIVGFNTRTGIKQYDYDHLDNRLEKSVIAQEFDSSKTYEVGDFCLYEGRLYKCAVAGTGEWNVNKWLETSVLEESISVDDIEGYVGSMQSSVQEQFNNMEQELDTWRTETDANVTRLENHQQFINQFKEEITAGILTLCPSMPSIDYWFLLHYVDNTKFLKDYDAVANLLARYLKPSFSDNTKPLKKLLKMEKYLKESIWVEKLCAGGKLDLAISRAEKNITLALETGELENQSYSFVYKVFKKTTTEYDKQIVIRSVLYYQNCI